MKNKPLFTPLLLSTLVSTLSSLPAHAQSGGKSRLLEEVVVTAQKRTENAQDVPIAIQVSAQLLVDLFELALDALKLVLDFVK